MQRKAKTIYQAARLTTPYTQEQAAELLPVSEGSVRAYERGVTVPPDDVVMLMIELYQTPWLAYLHLKQTSKVGSRYLPDIELRELSSSILDLQVTMKNTSKIQYDMAEVGRDNKMDKQEQPIYSKCISTIQSFIGAAFSIVFAPITKEKPPVQQHRAAKLNIKCLPPL